MLISRIFHLFNIDLSRKTFGHLGWINFFAKKILHKLNIFQLNGICQHGTMDDDHDDKDDEEPP